MRRRVAWCAVVLFPVGILGGLRAARRDLTKPNWVLPTQMAVSPAYKAETANPRLPGHMTMQPPVRDTLAREAHAFHYADTGAERRRAGDELTNQLSPTPEVLQRGKRVYETFCLVCHGPSGQGDGPIIPKFPNPPDFQSQQSQKLRDGEMFHIITLGRNKMASYASQLSWEERWQVILYVRSLQKAKP